MLESRRRSGPEFAEQVFIHEPLACADGFARTMMINRSLDEGRGVALAIRYDPTQLPALFTWRMLGVNTYVMGIEPANCPTIEGRVEAAKRGTLPMLEPGERRSYDVSSKYCAVQRISTASSRRMPALIAATHPVRLLSAPSRNRIRSIAAIPATSRNGTHSAPTSTTRTQNAKRIGHALRVVYTPRSSPRAVWLLSASAIAAEVRVTFGDDRVTSRECKSDRHGPEQDRPGQFSVGPDVIHRGNHDAERCRRGPETDERLHEVFTAAAG